MKLEDSLSCSQELANGTCPEPDESSANIHAIFIKAILILSSHLCLDVPSGLAGTLMFYFLDTYNCKMGDTKASFIDKWTC
jgi:hypothetical protein